MSVPNPPIVDGSPVSTVITLDFEPSDDVKYGDYELLVDISRSTTIVLTTPPGYSVAENGVRLYPVQKNGSGKIIVNSDKQSDMGKLKAGKYAEVFTGDLPEDFTFGTGENGSGNLTDSDGIEGEYEYLVHIVTPDGADSFADPGVRNR